MVNSKLTNREKELLELISLGLSNREIASKLHITESTVENHIHNIYKKLNIKNRAQAVIKALEIRQDKS